MDTAPIRLLVVDDNDFMAEALRRHLRTDPTIEWAGWLDSAAALPEAIAQRRPTIILLDVDIPGDDSFEALRTVTTTTPDARVIMFSGHIRKPLIGRAIADGAWGYLSKNEAVPTVLDAIRQVARGRFAMSPEVQEEHDRDLSRPGAAPIPAPSPAPAAPPPAAAPSSAAPSSSTV